MNFLYYSVLYLYLTSYQLFCIEEKPRIRSAYIEWKFKYVDKIFHDTNGYSELHTLVENPPTFIPNIDFLGIGYNVYYGNPLSTEGLDEGYRNFRMVSIKYPQNPQDSLTSDRQYFKPDGVRVMTQQSCSMSYSSQAIESSQSYTNKLSASLGISASFLVGSFSANAEYNNVKQSLESKTSTYVISNAQCVAFQAGLIKDSVKKAEISQEFKQLMWQLYEDVDNQNSFHKAFDAIGTHVVEEVRLGSSFGYVYELKQKQAQQAQQQGISLEVSAQIMSVKAGASTSYQEQSLNQFSSSMTNWKSISLGATPDPSNDVGQWAQQTITNPIPIHTQLIPIYQFVNDYVSISDLQVQDKGKLVSNLKRHLQTYCSHLKTIKKTVSCTPFKLFESFDDPNKLIEYFTESIPLHLTSKSFSKVVQNTIFSTFRESKVTISEGFQGRPDQQWIFEKLQNYPNQIQIKFYKNPQMCLTCKKCSQNIEEISFKLKLCDSQNPNQFYTIEVFDLNTQLIKIKTLVQQWRVFVKPLHSELVSIGGYLSVFNPEQNPELDNDDSSLFRISVI